ncbi:MAG: sigma 54-interacting transcriptional regulator [Polyangiaceae bacterium]|nr:sigma 54-interacting transcriptional regulator [Polyangiaceae bacterium]MCW5792156.1 sigma 54-interacting transcriptional regulator [Polyangiaceae bacterium]
MAVLRIHILNGELAGEAFEPLGDRVTIGRAASCDVALPAPHVSAEHLVIELHGESARVTDQHSTNGSELVRGGARSPITGPVELQSGDVLALGGGDERQPIELRVELHRDDDAQVVTTRPLSELGAVSDPRRDQTLRTLIATQANIGVAQSLDQVISAIADAALELVRGATHVTVVLRELDGDRFIPALSRVRSETGYVTQARVPLTRSVYRKVVSERCAVLAADAPQETFSSESLLGTGIRSTIGVPLWRGEELIGVLQVDNRDRPAMFNDTDVEVLGALAANASLAVDNARLIRRLKDAEQRLTKENVYLRRRDERSSGGRQIIGQSRAMVQLLEQLDKVVNTRVTVLIEGKTGTGKELIASAVHHRSERREKLFVAQNCAALPEHLLESELFGHKRGAFTGATEEKKGLFDVADGGTLFLDEVTEMPLTLQAKLLRVLQEGEIRPVGATQTRHVDVRIVAATNRDLEGEVREGRFREDLYYRLKVFPLSVPTLAERREDIPLLANHFLTRYSREYGRRLAGFDQPATELLVAYPWPGNVRELENEVQRCVIQAGEEELVGISLLSERVRQVEGLVQRAAATTGSLKDRIEQVEKFLVAECLREHDNNKTSAAKSLGITREGLHKKLKQLGLS